MAARGYGSALRAGVAAARGEYGDAAALLQEFTARVPRHIAAMNKLIEVSVDGGLEAPMFEAQASLADAYLQTGQGTEARAVAEDLVAREPVGIALAVDALVVGEHGRRDLAQALDAQQQARAVGGVALQQPPLLRVQRAPSPPAPHPG